MALFKGRERKAEAARQQAQSALDAQAVELNEFIAVAKEFRGFTLAELADRPPVVLKGDERTFLVIEQVALMEPRSTGGHWEGRNQGVSVHIPGTKSMRYRIGQTKGTFVAAQQRLTPIDEGSAVITDKRVVFAGPKYTREWLWAKTIAVEHDDDLPFTVIGVSNRQKSSGIFYGVAGASMARFRIDLALAVANGTTDALVAELSAGLARLLEQGARLIVEEPKPNELPPPPPSAHPS